MATATRVPFCTFLAASVLMPAGSSTLAAEPADIIGKAVAPPAIRQDEPLLGRLDFQLARQSMDQSALHWQKTNRCVTCHTTAAYLMARPVLSIGGEEQGAVREQLEEAITKKWPTKPPASVYIVATACSLAIHDRRTGGELHPSTRMALDKMWDVQREDGGFDWLYCGWAPMEIDDHYGVTFAAIGVGSAPGEYAKAPQAQKGLARIREYLNREPAPSAHHRAMLLWASLCVDGILTDAQKAKTLDELLSLQVADGGWSLAGMLVNWPEFKRKDELPQRTEQGDAYGTGMVVWLAMQAGVPASDPRIQKGIAWLKTHQRESGRWFTPSPTKDGRHYITNAGTAWAVLALHAAGEVPKDLAVRLNQVREGNRFNWL